MYHVYAIELSKRVFTENRRFREANPQFNGVLQCLYVGMTSNTPQLRFQQHKKRTMGKKGQALSASLVYKYGLYLRPSLYNHLNPIATYGQALRTEAAFAKKLRRQGYAVWYN